ncbi:MAG TPA: hypothetical protein VKT33_05025 [Candidatus Angelobacter sp.]|nr:hypothetical protein [Candidatus Angelobacter sp.]
MLLLITIFIFGALHGLGPDHLAAITMFGSQGGRDAHRLAFFALRFALGHALVIAVAGVLAKFGASLMPPLLEARFDVAGGILLVVTGLFLIIAMSLGKFRFHEHSHDHSTGSHRHWHLHFLRPRNHGHTHGKFALLMGAFFALGGFRALLTVAPIALAPALWQSVLRISVFTLGIIVSMVAYGLLSGSALNKLGEATGASAALWHRLSGYAVGVFSVVAGLLTLGEHVR